MPKNKSENKTADFLNRELWGMILTLFSAFILFCLITGDSIFYPFGGVCQTFTLGVFGLFSFPLFLFCFISGILIIVGKRTSKGRSKTIAVMLGILLFVAFAIAHTATSAYDGNWQNYIKEAYNLAVSGLSKDVTFGGAFFALIVSGAINLLSKIGAYALFSAIIILCLIIIFKDKIFSKATSVAKQKENNQSSVKLSATEVYHSSLDNNGMVETTNVISNQFQSAYDGYGFGRKLMVANNEFNMKTASDYSAYNAKNSGKVILNENSNPYVYSEEYNRKLGEKIDYVKNPVKYTNPKVKSEYSNIKNESNDSDLYRTQTFDEPMPESNMYIPTNYKNAVKNDSRKNQINTTLNEDEYNEIVAEQLNTASDDKIVDLSTIDEKPLEFNAVSTKTVAEKDENSTERHYERSIPRKSESANYTKNQKGQLEFADNLLKPDPKVMEVSSTNPIDNMPCNFKYNPPPITLLREYESNENYGEVEYFKREKATKIINTLKVLGGINAKIENVVHGPSVTRFDISIPDDVSIKSVLKYEADLKLRIETKYDIRIAPIPGTAYIGIEVPNEKTSIVGLREVVSSDAFKNAKPNTLTFAIGKNLIGEAVVADICKMPHLLIAGATGTGKSVGLNTLLVSLIMKYSPTDLRLVLVDPKMVEFPIFKGIPHMLFDDILCDAQKTVSMLNWVVKEMDARYAKLRDAVVHNIDEYNAQIDPRKQHKMYRLVIVIDEFADLMSAEKKSIENAIARIAQKARASGIYLILATQRPAVNIIEGSIKTNFTSRIAFKMSIAVDSNTILGESGAENLLGKGDLLYKTGTMSNAERAQGAFIDLPEIKDVVQYIIDHNESYFNEAAYKVIMEEGASQIENITGKDSEKSSTSGVSSDYIDALRFAVEAKNISISLLQRKLSFGFPKAAKIFDWMIAEGYVVESQAGKQKQVVLTKEEFEEMFGG